MVERQGVHIDNRAESTALCIMASKNEPADAGFDHCAGAHDAWFHGHEQAASGEAIVADIAGCFFNGDDLGVSGGVVEGPCHVVGTGYDRAVFCRNERSNRDLILPACFVRLQKA
ncbi:MAG TPA: hypothetical protein PLR60_06565 [Syntrophorhabdaceae bacterium]|nr:hypothetical protein [Syntrophorhabdaceae bacterium]